MTNYGFVVFGCPMEHAFDNRWFLWSRSVHIFFIDHIFAHDKRSGVEAASTDNGLAHGPGKSLPPFVFTAVFVLSWVFVCFKKEFVWLKIWHYIDFACYAASRELHEDQRQQRHIKSWRKSLQIKFHEDGFDRLFCIKRSFFESNDTCVVGDAAFSEHQDWCECLILLDDFLSLHDGVECGFFCFVASASRHPNII